MQRERCGSVVWMLRLAEWRASGLSLAAYCRWAGLCYPTAVAWRRRLVQMLLGPLPVFSVRR